MADTITDAELDKLYCEFGENGEDCLIFRLITALRAAREPVGDECRKRFIEFVFKEWQISLPEDFDQINHWSWDKWWSIWQASWSSSAKIHLKPVPASTAKGDGVDELAKLLCDTLESRGQWERWKAEEACHGITGLSAKAGLKDYRNAVVAVILQHATKEQAEPQQVSAETVERVKTALRPYVTNVGMPYGGVSSMKERALNAMVDSAIAAMQQTGKETV